MEGKEIIELAEKVKSLGGNPAKVIKYYQAELEKARELLKKVIECRGLIYSAPFLEEDIDTFLNEGKK